jgi:hypothetical protein
VDDLAGTFSVVQVPVAAVARALGRRPDLWPAAARQAVRLVPRRWWRRPPFLPLPDRGWLRFRLEAQYGGDGTGPVRPEDLVAFLEWCRVQDRL